MAKRDYISDGYCGKCKKWTKMFFHDEGHERDSSYDRQVCFECRHEWWGIQGEWSDKPEYSVEEIEKLKIIHEKTEGRE